MKKAIFGLLVMVAIGASAFTNAESKVKRASYYYVLENEETYVRVIGVPSEFGCQDVALAKCVIGFDVDPELEEFPSDQLPPETITYTSEDNGIWTEPQAN